MAVRFLPAPEERRGAVREDRTDLAEVIELRSLLRRPAWGGAPADERLDASRCAEISDGDGNGDSDGGEPGRLRGEAEDMHGESEGGEPGSVHGGLDGCAPEGEEIDDDDELEIDASEARESCKSDGVRILARRARSSGELRDELLRLEHAVHDVEEVIAEFEQSLYLDDAGLARVLTEKLRETKRASRSQIRLKLRERKLSDAVIEAAVGELDTDEEHELLREAAEERARKLGGLDRQTAERRLLGFLARRGWSGEPAVRAAREALDGGARRSKSPGTGVRFS